MVVNNENELAHKIEVICKLIMTYWMVLKLQKTPCMHSERRLSDESLVLISIRNIGCEDDISIDRLGMIIQSAIYSYGFSCKEHYYLRYMKMSKEIVRRDIFSLEDVLNEKLKGVAIKDSDMERYRKIVLGLKVSLFSMNDEVVTVS